MSEMRDITAPAENAEGTMSILKAWHKGVGDAVVADEPLAELETDKVAVEIAAPEAGVIVELVKQPDEEVQPGEVMARMQTGAQKTNGVGANGAASNGAVVPSTPSEPSPASQLAPNPDRTLSPAVRRLVAEHDLDPSEIAGTGRGGRITRADTVRHIEGGATAPRQAKAPAESSDRPAGAIAGSRIPLDSMRRQIAHYMVKSVTDAPHVTALFEADLSAITRQPHGS